MNWRSPCGELYRDCAIIYRVRDEFGEFSNMKGGFPLRVNGVRIPSSEALYQACRFPHEPEWQREILEEASPMSAKLKAKKEGRRENHSRPDWRNVSIDVMRWVIRVKMCQQYRFLVWTLKDTKERAIVEKSRNDSFWGAVEEEEGVLVGQNHLGRLWMELRDEILSEGKAGFEEVAPLPIEDFLLLGEPIGVVRAGDRIEVG